MNLLIPAPVYISETGFNHSQAKGGDDVDEFENLLEAERVSVERFVRFRISSKADADDVLQEVFLTAYQKFPQLKNQDAFKAWIISIARNKCNDYFRKKATQYEIPIDELSDKELSNGRYGVSVVSIVREILSLLGDKDKQILYLYFWKEMPQSEIAKRLNIPIGTVKSRLHTAKQNFKNKYPYRTDVSKGESEMKKLPEIMPQYSIHKSVEPPFEVRHEELPGMMIIPQKGEKRSFAMYDFPEKKQSGVYHLNVTGEVVIHDICGVEIASQYVDPNGQKEENTIFAQLTDSHCRYLGGMRVENGVRHITTFLDGDAFTQAYAIGKDNCGFEVNRRQRNIIKESDNGLVTDASGDITDIVGRYTVSLGGKIYDTVRLIDMQEYGDGSYMLCEYYLDQNGKTILWRRFNRDDWAIDRYKQKWSEQLPENDRLTVNGATYVHWYDCITDYIL